MNFSKITLFVVVVAVVGVALYVLINAVQESKRPQQIVNKIHIIKVLHLHYHAGDGTQTTRTIEQAPTEFEFVG